MRTWKLTMALLVAASVAGTSGACLAQEIIVPTDWAGVWEISYEIHDCNTQELIETFADTDTLCSGATLEIPGVDLDLTTITCTGSIDGNTVSLECTGEGEPSCGCTADYTLTASVTRSGESYTGTTTITATYGGTCAGEEPFCMEIEATAERIAGEPPSCDNGSPVESLSWGTLKGVYR